MADHTTDPPTAPSRNKLPTGDANPNSKAARLIRNSEFDELRADRDRLQRELDAIRDAETDQDEQAGALNSGRMRKILGQRAEQDRGPLEKTLREWLVKSPKDFIGAMEGRERAERGVAAEEAENARLREEVKELNEKYAPPERDEGSELALDLIERILADCEAKEEAKRIAQCPTCGRGKDWKPAT